MTAITPRHACLCCGFLTLEEPPGGTFEICPVCFWEDDHVQADDPDYPGAANVVSLNQARANYRAFGACEREMLEHVRAPLPDELPTTEPAG